MFLGSRLQILGLGHAAVEGFREMIRVLHQEVRTNAVLVAATNLDGDYLAGLSA